MYYYISTLPLSSHWLVCVAPTVSSSANEYLQVMVSWICLRHYPLTWHRAGKYVHCVCNHESNDKQFKCISFSEWLCLVSLLCGLLMYCPCEALLDHLGQNWSRSWACGAIIFRTLHEQLCSTQLHSLIGWLLSASWPTMRRHHIRARLHSWRRINHDQVSSWSLNHNISVRMVFCVPLR